MSKIIDNQSFLIYFFEDPNRWFHVREMARLLKLNPSTASKYLNQLYEGGFLTRKHERGHLLFKPDNQNSNFKDAKIYHNIRSIRNSGLIEYLDKHLHYPETISIFGSYSKGDNDKKSDIDFFVISNGKKELNLDVFEKKLKAKIHLFIKTKNEFSHLQKENKNLANSIINGIVLKGYLEVFHEV